MRRILSWIAAAAVAVGTVVLVPRVLPAGEVRADRRDVYAGSHSAVEGVQVHGHWRLRVQNPDGSSAGLREFENEFIGHFGLRQILLGDESFGRWGVHLGGSNGPCSVESGRHPTRCLITEPDVTRSPPGRGAPIHSTNLVADSHDGIRLRGSVIVQRDGTVSRVESIFGHCDPRVPPTNCRDLERTDTFTSTDVDPPVELRAGQQVLVEVNISFS